MITLSSCVVSAANVQCTLISFVYVIAFIPKVGISAYLHEQHPHDGAVSWNWISFTKERRCY